MRRRARNSEGLEAIGFVERVSDMAHLGRLPVARLVSDLHRLGRDRRQVRLRMRRSGPDGRSTAVDAHSGPERERVNRARHREARWDETLDPIEQDGGFVSHPRRWRETRRILGRHAVDDGEARIDGGAMARIDAAVDRGREHNAAAFLKAHEGRMPAWILGREAGAGDGDKTPAIGKARQRRGDVAQGGIGNAALDMGGRREGRVHQHDRRADRGIEMIVDLGRVMARDGYGQE